MKKKIWILSIGAAILLVLSFFPTIGSQSTETNDGSGPTVEWKVYHIKGNWNIGERNWEIENAVKELALAESEELMDELRQFDEESDLTFLTLKEQLEGKLEILKEYGLVSSDKTLADIITNPKIQNDLSKPTPIEIVTGENFEAHFAPIFFAGTGFGFGFGVPSPLTIGTFLVAMAGAGLVLCLDVLYATLYTLQMFLMPVLIGFLTGFIGLLLFAVVPGVFFSNFVALGMVADTIWLQIPSP